jgi:ATP adenylyltransferase
MKKIYAPWRHGYVTNEPKKNAGKKGEDECVFCQQFSQNEDEKHLILKRYSLVGVIMNYYPYNAGHLMVLPFTHKAELSELTKDERAEMMEATTKSIQALKKGMGPAGFNVGINLGQGSGGGIPSHIHIHILPRWHGDTNFMPTLADTKVICSDFNKIYQQLKPHF